MSRSSIFSFDSLRGFEAKFPATLVLVVCAVAGLEIGLRLLPDAFIFHKSRSRQGVFTFFEQEVIPRFEKPQIVVMGSSRAEDAVIPRLLDQRLGLPENASINLGLQGGNPFDALQFYERNRDRLGKARLIILMLDEWHFSSGWSLGPRYALRASLPERIAVVQDTRMPTLQSQDSTGDSLPARVLSLEERQEQKRTQLTQVRTVLISDYFLSMRLKLRYIPDAVGNKLLGMGKSKGLIVDENNQVVRPEEKRNLEFGKPILDPSLFAKRIHGFYENFDSHPLLIGHVEKLADLAKADGARFVIIHMPNRGMHQAEVERLYGPCFEQYLAAIKSIAESKGASYYIFKYQEECGLIETHFLDYGHLANAGSRVFTEFLAELIKKEALLRKE